MTLNIIESLADLRQQLARWRQAGDKIAFVPTMGNLHAGHLALCKRAAELADRVVVSIYVNPMQFGAGEDFGTYPRTLEADRLALQGVGIDGLYLPTESIMYPEGVEKSTCVMVPEIADLWCGASRPGHFTGVTTVVAKFFQQIQPEVAVFGEKDFQQLLLIRRMVMDLFMPVEIIGVPTFRESDGLAMSSRNQYLSQEQRQKAVKIHESLNELEGALLQGERNFRKLEQIGFDLLEKYGFSPDYYTICRTDDLQPASGDAEIEVVVLVAAYLGKARLIDNRVISLRNDV